MVGTPWKMAAPKEKPALQQKPLTTPALEDALAPAQAPQERTKQVRRAKISAEDIDDAGPTPGCDGCSKTLMGVPGTVHTEDGRKRITGIMIKKGHPKWMKELERITT